MNGITHKQARKWIDRRQDGLLKGNQQTLLEEHLHSCDSCQSYSEEMELLASRLNREFHARWEDDPGPSKIIVENVRAKVKSIPAAKRFSSGFQLAGGVTVLVVLGIVINFFVSQMRDSAPVANGTEVVSSFPAAEDRLIAFSSTQNGNSDIYTMHANGSGLTNITNNPAYDGFPHWSPDGKQIAFESDRDGSSQIYLMDADGSNVIQLTHGDENNFLAGSIDSPWSPDGSRLLVNRQTDSQNHQIYVIDVAGTNAILLTKDAGQYYFPLWSPNGEYIAFISDEANDPSNNRHLYIVDSQGNDLIDLTENLPQNERLSFADYYWSADGNFITFTTDSQSGTYKSTVYKASLDGARVQVTRTNQQILDWWNGIALQENPPQKVDETSWSIVQADGSQASLSTCKSDDRSLTYYAVKRSLNGNLFFGFHCTPSGWMLYGVNRDGSNVHELISSPLDGKYDSLDQVAWSPDDHFLAFLALDGENIQVEDLYILNANNPSAQPLKMENSSSPSWQPVINENLVKEKSPVKLTIDPQSCKPAEGNSVPGELYGYDVIQNTSYSDGDFTYDFWLYCDPALKPDDPEHISAVAGLGIYSAWTYTGPQVDGPVQYYYAFDPDQPFGTSGTDGPLYKASASAKFGIDLSESQISEYIQQGLPVRFSVVVDSSLGQNGAVLSFALEPTERGYKISSGKAEKLNDSNQGLIAFTAIDKSGNTNIFTTNPDGSGLVNLTNGSAIERNLVWSPDGTRLAFVSDQDGKENILVMDADGSNLITLTDAPGWYAGLLWSPDGTRLAYTLQDPDGKSVNIYVMDANGQNQRRVTDRHPEPDDIGVRAEGWSPDGKYIYYSDYLAPGQSHILKLNAESGESTVITAKMWDRPFSITVNQDGSKILYFTFCGKVMDFCLQAKSVGQDGTNELTHEPMQVQQVCPANNVIYGINYLTAQWSPDRTKIIFAIECPYRGAQLYTANADGSDFKSVNDPDPFPYKDIRFDWSSDNQSIAFIHGPDPSKTGLSLWVVQNVLHNPHFSPTWLDLDASQIGELAWQPAP